MKKMLHVAIREFMATVATKGFIFGVLFTPVLIAIMVVVMPRLMNEAPPRVIGEVAVVDRTGEITGGLRDYLEPKKIAERRNEFRKKIEEATPAALRSMSTATPQAKAAREQALAGVMGEVPKLTVVELPATADLESVKAPLKDPPKGRRGADEGRIAVAVIHPDAVVKDAAKDQFGSYDLFVKGKLDDRIEDEIRGGLKEAIVDARVKHSGLDRKLIESITNLPRVQSKTVTTEGERNTNEVLNVLLPAGFMLLLMMSVLTSGQYLLTSTVEEKSNRVVEVLLSAVSPMELMVGKILGQMAVGFVMMALYAGLGIAALLSFAMLALLDVKLIFFLCIFYVLAYVTIASLMAAIGAAVNEMREAQSLMTPVMLLIMIPWVLWMPITRNPNSTFATVMSFIPPVSNFVTLLRMTSTSPPPMWQVGLSIVMGMLGVWVAVWFAAKVFRIGLLMFGKPPTFATLIKWVRMA